MAQGVEKTSALPTEWKHYLREVQQAKNDHEKIVEEFVASFGTSPGEGWVYYNSPLLNDATSKACTGYFTPFVETSFEGLGGYSAEKFLAEIKKFRAAPENAGKSVMIFDALGQGTPFVDIADEIVATTLTKNPTRVKNVTEFNGDALSKDVSEKVFEHIRKKIRAGTALRATFFRPVAGMERGGFNLYVLHTLYERLRELYELTDEGGLIFLQTTNIGHDIDFLETILSGKKMRSIRTADAMPHHRRILIRKNSRACSQLPTIEEIARKRPKLIKQLMSLNKRRKNAAIEFAEKFMK